MTFWYIVSRYECTFHCWCGHSRCYDCPLLVFLSPVQADCAPVPQESCGCTDVKRVCKILLPPDEVVSCRQSRRQLALVHPASLKLIFTVCKCGRVELVKIGHPIPYLYGMLYRVKRFRAGTILSGRPASYRSDPAGTYVSYYLRRPNTPTLTRKPAIRHPSRCAPCSEITSKDVPEAIESD